MEIREIFDTIESDPNMDEELQQDILKKIENIANADKIVDGLEEKIEQHKSELSEKELKYIINKCIAYKSVFYRFRNGKIVEYDQLNEITNRIFQLEDSIRNNDFSVWKEELLAYKGSKEDKAEDKMLKNMLMVVPEESNVVDKVTRMFKRAMWKFQQKMKEKQKQKEDAEVIELPQTTNSNIDINIDDDYEEKENVEENTEVVTEQQTENLETTEIEEDETQVEASEDTNQDGDTEVSENDEIEENNDSSNIEEDKEEKTEGNTSTIEDTQLENEEVEQEEIEKEDVSQEIKEEKIEDAKEEVVEEKPMKRTRKGSGSTTTSKRTRKGNQQSTNIEEEQEKEVE